MWTKTDKAQFSQIMIYPLLQNAGFGCVDGFPSIFSDKFLQRAYIYLAVKRRPVNIDFLYLRQ